jgi:hypothetical protein
MTTAFRIPAIISALLLGAHFLRNGQYGFVLLALALVPLLFVRHTWAVRIVQTGLLAGAGVWIATAVSLLRARLALGEPYLRMVVILGAVAAFTLLSALLLRRRQPQPVV